MKNLKYIFWSARFVLLALLILLPLKYIYGDAEVVWTDWFKMYPETATKWEIISYPENGLRIEIQYKNASASESRNKIFVLFPKKSSAYDTAMDKILNVFEDKGIPADFTLIFYKGEDELGKEAIKIANENGVKAEPIMKEGNIAAEIIKFIKKERIDLVAIGSRGLSRLPRYVLGSISNKIANYAPCQVLIVK